jgi:hypothetical protein
MSLDAKSLRNGNPRGLAGSISKGPDTHDFGHRAGILLVVSQECKTAIWLFRGSTGFRRGGKMQEDRLAGSRPHRKGAAPTGLGRFLGTLPRAYARG